MLCMKTTCENRPVAGAKCAMACARMSMTLRLICAALDNSCACTRLQQVRHRYNRSDSQGAQGGFCTAARSLEGGGSMKMGIVLLTAVSASLLAAHAFAGDYQVPRLPDGTP